MGRGIIFGVLWGLLFSAVGLAGVSLMLPAPAAPGAEMAEAAAEAAEPEAVDAPEPEAAPEAPAAEAEAAAAVEPETEPEAEAVAEPEAPAAEAEALAVPEPPAAAPEAASEPPAAPEPAPVPEEEDAALPASEPAPALAEVPAVDAPQGEPAPALIGVAPAAPPGLAAAPETLPAAPAGDAAPALAAVEEAPVGLPGAQALPQAEPAPAAPAVATEPAAPPAPEVAAAEPEPEPLPELAEEELTDLAPEAEDGELSPRIVIDAPAPPQGVAGAPRPGFANAAGVRTNRLPRIGDDAEAEPAAVEGEEAIPDPADLPAIRRNAAAFENPDELPLFSVVLIDVGEEAGGLDPETLSTLAVPVTIALDPTRPGVEEQARAYRAAGLEVALLATGIPEGATAADMEQTFQSWITALPEAAAVTETPELGFQNNRQMSQHLVALLAAEGLGLVTYDKGLNPAGQLAAGAGLPSVLARRVLDPNGEGEDAVRRALDRAAFEAAQSGSAVVVGHSYPATVAALFAWAEAGGRQVALAPVSAVAR